MTSRDDSVCSACLARDRSVAPLGAGVLCYVYCALTDCGDVDTARVSVCWECAALLRRAARFRLRATRAHFSLQAAAADCVDIKPDSSLCCTGPVALVLIDPEQGEPAYEYKVDVVKHKYHSETPSEVDQFDYIDKFEEAEDNAIEIDVNVQAVDIKYSCKEEYIAPVEHSARKRKKESTTKKKKRKPAAAEESLETNGENQPENKSSDIKSEDLLESRKQQVHTNTICHSFEQERTNKLSETCESSINKGSIQCQVCAKHYQNAKALHGHMYYCHREFGKFQKGRGRPRTVSSTSKVSEAEMWRYREEEANSVVFRYAKWKCEKCVLVLPHETAFNKHEGLHLRKSKFMCKICTLPISTLKLFQEHMSAHYTLFSCTQCDFNTQRRKKMRRHREAHKNNKVKKEFECYICGASFKDWKEKNAHIQEHKDIDVNKIYECDLCPKKFKYRKAIERHLSTHYQNKNYMYQCPACPFKTIVKNTLAAHYNNHHKIAPILSEVFCVKCNKQYYTEAGFRSHMTGVHEKKKLKLPCSACDRTFCNKYSLNNHFNYAHLKQTNYECKICKKNLSKKSTLKEHVKRIHEGYRLPKIHACDTCGRRFSVKKTLVHHVRTHTGEKPHKCEYCNSAFAQKIAMQSHVKNVHLKEKGTTTVQSV